MGKLLSETTTNELSNVAVINTILFRHNPSYLKAKLTHLKIGFKEVGCKMDLANSEYDPLAYFVNIPKKISHQS
jgi:hypothetical protein